MRSKTDLRYRARSYKRYSFYEEPDLIRFGENGDQQMMPRSIIKTIEACNTFLPLERHAERLCAQNGHGSERYQAIYNLLTDLAKKDFLRSDASILACHRAITPEPATPPAITSMGIITSDHPLCLTHSLTTYVDNAVKYGQQLCFRIIDDSKDPIHCRQNVEGIARIQKKSGLTALYIGVEQRRALVQKLVCKGIARDIAEFALLNPLNARFSAGAARNALLLATGGEIALSSDDDTICALVSSADTFPHLAVTSRELPTSIAFFADRQGLMSSSSFSSCSMTGLHAAVLGRQLSDLTRSFSTLQDVEESAINVGLMCNLESGRGSVLLTQCGLVGDSGLHSPAFYLAAEGVTRSNLLQSEATYHSAIVSRQVKTLAATYTLTDSPLFMGYAFGMDNREGLAPFFPIQRNEDGVFGLLIRICFEHSYTCHLPYGVLHDPPDHRRHAVDSIWNDSVNIRISDVVQACLRACHFDVSIKSPAARLRRIGEYLTELGSLPRGDFWETVRHLTQLLFINRINKIGRLYEKDSVHPDYWKKDIARSLDGQRGLLLRTDFPSPRDLPHIGNDTQDSIKTLILKYGGLLKSWPDMIKAAADIKSKETIGMPIR